MIGRIIAGQTRGANPVRRLRLALAALMLLLLVGTLGFRALSGARWIDALYHTVITISTVGYGETVPIDTPAKKLFTIGLILSAAIVTAWAVGSAAELLFAEYIWTQLGRQRMQRRIDDLTGHTIVCGYGRMGRRVIEELSSEGHPWVVVDLDPARCAAARAAGGLVVEGDATHDEMLLGAGVARARALITVTRADATNIVITLSARALNPGILIGARAGDADVVSKLYRAGATYVLQHHGTAAMHLALSVTHPVVEEVLNLLIPRQGRVDLGQLVVTARSQLAGHTLASLDTGRYGALVIAIAHGGELAIPPRSDVPLEVGDVLVVAGPAGVIKTLRERTHTVEHRPDELPPAS